MPTHDLYDTIETRNMPSNESTSNNTGNDFDHDNNKNEDRARLDPMLMELLESLREVYMKRRDQLLKKIDYEESIEVLKKLKISIRKNKKKLKTQTIMKRSLSVGDEMRNEKFKIKTPHVVIVARPNGQNGSNN
ncbi:hypothetical protein R3W88_028890 [Solanum pinnatisectum]|uniref:Uncharacterized protein n=1 Tax=Solanum pinnatisectum TaxID=50273 RepID=A0AAV9K3R4_9SOLN|nr:hypothetical protein R3W88_028890 [Solanum pinnatisectum]